MIRFLREVIQPFLRVESSIRMLVLGDLFLQFGNVALFLLLNYYLMDLGYEDAQIASLHSTRYFGVILFAAGNASRRSVNANLWFAIDSLS